MDDCWGVGWLMGNQHGIPVCEINIWCPVGSRALQLILARAASCVLLPIKRFIAFMKFFTERWTKGKN